MGLVLATWQSNRACLTLSLGWHIGMNPTWSQGINSPIMVFNRVASIFARSLILRFRREIGRQFAQEVDSDQGLDNMDIIAVNVLDLNDCPVSS